MIKIYENKLGVGHYDPETKIAHLAFSGGANRADGVDFFDHLIEFSKSHQVLGEISDSIKLTGTFTDVMDYFQGTFFPAMIGQGMKAHAQVHSTDVFSQFAYEKIGDNVQEVAGGALTMADFEDIEEAKKWIYDFLEIA